MQIKTFQTGWFKLWMCPALGLFLGPISSANGQTVVSLRALQPVPNTPVLVSLPSPESTDTPPSDPQTEPSPSHLDLDCSEVTTANLTLQPLPGVVENVSPSHPVISVVSLQPMQAQQDKVQGNELLNKLFDFEVVKLTEDPTNALKMMKDLQTDRRYFESALVAEPTRLQSPDIGPYAWNAHGYCWESPAFCFSPLYFEQPNLERYGQGVGRPFASTSSALKFVTDVTTLPIAVVCTPPWSSSCTLGHHRPGDCAPYQRKTLDH